MSLELKTRDVILKHINVRTEKHGLDEKIPARDLKLTFLLSKSELNKLVGDKYKFDQLYNVGVKPYEPLWNSNDWGPHKWKAKFTECEFDLSFGVSQKQITVDDEHPVKAKGFEFVATIGGQTQMTCTVQGVFELNAALAELDAFQDKNVSVRLKLGEIDAGEDKDDDQDELDLDHKAQGDDDTVDETDEEAERKPAGRGRRPSTDASLN